MIPKICNFYWGGKPLSYLQYLTIVSFKKHNPSWKINLFMPKVASAANTPWQTLEQEHDYSGDDYIEQAKSLCTVHLVDFDELGMAEAHEVHRSDLIRWKILHDIGGVWSDMDILYVKPIPEIDGDVALVFDGFHHIIGFYMTKPGQKIFSDIYNSAKNIATPEGLKDYQAIGSRLLMHMFPKWSDILQKYPGSEVINLPVDMIYPYGSHIEDLEQMFNGTVDKVTEETVGIHWYNGSGVAKSYQNRFESSRLNNSPLSKRVPHV